MFDQPPLTAREGFGRGFVEGLALLFVTLLLSLASMLPTRSHLYFWIGSLRTSLLFVWPVLGTVGCVALLLGNEERPSVYRAGVLASYAVFLGMIVAMWAIKP